MISPSGEFKDGTHWRYIGMFGGSAAYSGADTATAKLLDQMMEGACWHEQTANR